MFAHPSGQGLDTVKWKNEEVNRDTGGQAHRETSTIELTFILFYSLIRKEE